MRASTSLLPTLFWNFGCWATVLNPPANSPIARDIHTWQRSRIRVEDNMGIIELLGLAASLSLLSGWRFYLTIFATGLAMHFQIVPLPENLQMLDVLANPWVLGISAVGAVAEFFADKIAWLDSIWDGIHTLVRPVGGALLALAIVDSSDPTWQVIAFLLGGGAAFASHATKASARAAGIPVQSPSAISSCPVSRMSRPAACWCWPLPIRWRRCLLP